MNFGERGNLSLAVKKGVALFKIASVKKAVESKGVAKKWL